MSDFEHRPDSGRLMASTSKKTAKSPDYWGDIAINVKDLTKVKRQGELLVFQLSGWKKKTKAGVTFLSLAIDRYIPKDKDTPKQDNDFPDEDIPF